MFGWQRVKMHCLTYNERIRLYWPLPDRWLVDYEGKLRFAVPTPIACAYATSMRRQTEPGSPARTMLDEIFRID